VLLSLQRSAPIRFELVAVNLDQKQPGFPQHVLPDYLTALEVPHHVIEQDTYRVVKRVIPAGRTMCGLCSRLRRGALYRYASENGITKVALGHHRDDIVETLFLNMFFGGRMKSMPPKLLSEDGRHIVIRPMAYVPEREIERYARARQFPIIPCTLCGSQQHLQRVTVKKMLTDWEREFPGRTEAIFSSLSNVTTSHLADPQAFDFAGLEARRAAALAALRQAAPESVETAATPVASVREPWEEP
jgi:tRNA 2-thiocytidine biosynthesis protein TtcA